MESIQTQGKRLQINYHDSNQDPAIRASFCLSLRFLIFSFLPSFLPFLLFSFLSIFVPFFFSSFLPSFLLFIYLFIYFLIFILFMLK